MTVCVLIPALNPVAALVSIVRELSSRISCPIVIVDDGSSTKESEECFETLRKLANTRVLTHATNLGKGAALKTGFNHILVNHPDVRSIVTADADGQHLPDDIVQIAGRATATPGALVLGVRSFSRNIPLRSLIGNEVSRFAYRVLLGLKLADTQTGLRAIPVQLAKLCLSLTANRYEFETEMLVAAKHARIEIEEQTIQTVYLDGNATSHFNPILDSARIYFALFRYSLSSLATFGIDFIVFAGALQLIDHTIAANISSRAVALFVQFYLLKTFVFKTEGDLTKFVLFILYVMVMGVASGSIQVGLAETIGLAPYAAKIVVEVFLFFFNFLFLRDILFQRSRF